MSSDLRAEYSALVSAFTERLRTLQHRGVYAVPAAPSPRLGVAPDLLAEEVSEEAYAPPYAPPSLADLRAEIEGCSRCRLAAKRANLVFGVGAEGADLMFVGEGPGYDEDREGEPFVGAAGQLLTKMIKAMGLTREEVYITNIVKCHPPRNRDPEPDEIDACEPFLRRQIDAIGPRFIIALGGFAAKTLLGTDTGITRLRGTMRSYHGIPLMPTFHPAYLLRNPEQKRPVWNDLQAVMAEMDRLGINRRR